VRSCDRIGILSYDNSTTVIVLSLLLIALPGSTAPLLAQEKSVEPPALGQPEDFSQLVGSFKLEVSASPTEVFVEEPILVKVSIQGNGPDSKYLPQRKNLKIFPKELKRDFFIGELSEKDSHDAKNNTWVFYYQFLPKNEKVTKIPFFKLTYFHPSLPQEFAYQPSLSKPISLKVKLRPEVIVAPERMYQFTSGDAVLRQSSASSVHLLVVILGLVLPPVGSVLGLRLWRYYHPDSATAYRRRQSKAARQTLKALRQLRHDPGGQGTCSLFTRYLHVRLNLAAVEPTPQETIEHLARVGLSLPLTEQVAHFYRAAHELRFAPVENQERSSLKSQALRLIPAIEEESP
jgi:hypothetical protein